VIKRFWIVWVTLAVIITGDQVTKHIIDTNLTLHESRTVIPGLFSITYIRNPGAAFGFLADASPPFRSLFFLAVTMGAVGLIVYYLKTQPIDDSLMTLSLSLILAGALGNLVDRVRFGEVIDFLDFYIGSAHWPAFNVADSSISVGAFLLFLSLVRGKGKTAVSHDG